MKLQVFLLCLAGAVFARPEFGYTSPTFPVQPSGSYLPGHTSVPSQPSTSYTSGGTNIHGYNQDMKHVYFFAAPEEEETSRFRVYVQPSSARNTRIIFIKAPSYGGVVPEVIPPPSETVDRTLVYVLSKNQQQGGSVTIPANLSVKHAKPEVYFVKYRNQHDAEGVVHQGLNGQSVGTGLDDLGNAQSFTSRLDHSSGFSNNGFTSGFSNNGFTSGGSYQNSAINTNYGPSSGSGPYY